MDFRHVLYFVTWFICLSACTGSVSGTGRSGGGGCGSGGRGECQGENCGEIPIPPGFPKTLVSAGKRTSTSSGQSAAMLVDGRFRGSSSWNAGRSLPAWAAIEVGGGIGELLLSWSSSGNYDYPEIRYGAPASYRIETSANSSDGRDGTWNEVLTVRNNTVRARTHCIPFANQRWLRFVVLSDAGTENGVQIDEIELHDNSDGKIDGWFFFGDSITAHAFDRQESQNPAFASLLWAADENHYPLQVNGGYGGDTARCVSANRQCSLERLRQALDENEGYRVVALGLGTNDFGAMADYRTAMRALIQEVQSRGKIAIIPLIPWARGRSEATQEAMNQVVDELRQEFNLPRGPDFYTHFRANPSQLRDELHPNAQGCKEMNRLWAEAAKAVPRP
ncbi:MAG: SGNH/GDSL hydrolase family protein [Cystobacterineae bacterium]|nr:SGNH/GDSL hydrolase family protein [Cystobacterineae bacterium]